jgi:RND family efflux transporter MFP subunit
MNTSGWFGALSAAVMLGAALPGCRPAAEPPEELPRVTVAHPEVRELVDEDDYNGSLKASQSVDVRARVRGHIQKIDFKDGDLVAKGQLLIQLDPRPFQASLDELLAQAKALDAKWDATQKNVVRTTELVKAKAIAQAEYEQIVADAAAYKAEYNAKLEQANRARLDLEYARITAPISGRIGRAMLTEGNLVNAGGSDPVLTTIVDSDPIYVYFNVDERAAQRYQKSDLNPRDRKTKVTSLREMHLPFYFGLDTDEGFPHQGLLDYVGNEFDKNTGTVEVRGTAHNPGGKLASGSRVRVRVPVSEPYKAVLVPDTCVLTDQDRRYVLVLGKDNLVLRRDIIPGRLLDDGMRVVLGPGPGSQPITAKDWVITLGLLRAAVNDTVEPLDANGNVVK